MKRVITLRIILQIHDIEPVFAIPDDKVCDLQSDYYKWGLVREADQKDLQEYITQMFAQLDRTESEEEMIVLYQDLVALADYAARFTKVSGRFRRCIQIF